VKRYALLTATSLAVLLVCTCALAQKIYWTDVGHNKIRRANLDGSEIEELVTSGLDAPGVIAVDRTAGKMYWTDWAAATARIQRANLDGTEVEDLVTGLAGPYGIALDTAAGKMYWTEFSVGAIRRANLDGSGREDLVTTGQSHLNGIALDLAAGKMYWCDGGYYGYIRCANLDGSDIEDLIVAGLSSPMEIELDLAAQKMYWTDLGTDKIQRADLNGGNVEDLITVGYGTFVGLGLDPVAGKMYYSDFGDPGSQLRRANLDGTGIETIVAAGIGACYGLTLDVAPTTDAPAASTAALRLDPVFPNPFNPVTVLSYRLGMDTEVLLSIFNLRGEHITTLVDGFYGAGDYQIAWNGQDDAGRLAPSGTYLCHIKAGQHQATQKVVLTK